MAISENDTNASNLRKTLYRLYGIDNALEEHSFPKKVREQILDEKRHILTKIPQISRSIINTAMASGSNAFEAESELSNLYVKIKEEASSHQNVINGKKKWMWIIGGPNGAGKSTFVDSEYGALAGYLPLVNPDIIAKQLNPDNVSAAAMEAGRIAVDRMNQYAEEGHSFIVETTLSGNMQYNLAKELKEKGWKVGFVYITNNSPDISVERVKSRVAKGGHDVPEEDIRRRWERSHTRIAPYTKLADAAYIIDNSTHEGFMLAASGGNGHVVPIRKELLPHVMDDLSSQGLVKQLAEAYAEIHVRRLAKSSALENGTPHAIL